MDMLDTLKAKLLSEHELNYFKANLKTILEESLISSEMTDQEKSAIEKSNHEKKLDFIGKTSSTEILVMLLFCYREVEFNLCSMKEHLLCINNCFNQLRSKKIVKVKTLVLEEFSKLFRKLTMLIVDTKLEVAEKENFLDLFIEFCGVHSEILKKINGSIGVDQLSAICSISNKLRLGKLNPKTLVTKMNALNHIKDINYYNKVFKLALNIYQKYFPQSFEQQNFILQCLKIDNFQTSYQLAKSIDKLLPKHYNANNCLNHRNFRKIYKITNKKENMNLLSSAYDEYLNTDIEEFPEFNTSLIMIFYYFIKLFEEEDSAEGSRGGKILKNYFEDGCSLNNYFKLTQIIRVLSLFNRFERFIATEILQLAVRKGDLDFLCFFSNANASFYPKRLSSELVNIYIEKALQPPYHMILLQFFNPILPSEKLEVAIRKGISKAITVDLPNFASGLTLSNMTICLPNPKKKKFGNGIQFYILLHELAHYLQRTNVLYFRDSLENRSEKLIDKIEKIRISNSLKECASKIENPQKPSSILNPVINPIQNQNIVEGGEYLEFLLFGGPHKKIYRSAADFLFECHEDDLEKFREKFLSLNKGGKKENEFYYTIRELGSDKNECYRIGECGTKDKIRAYKIYKNERKKLAKSIVK